MKKLRIKAVLFYSVLFLISSDRFIHAQNDSSKALVSLTFKDKPLREVLVEIAHQSKSTFVYCDRFVNGKTISCTMNNLTLEEALQKISTQAGLSFKIFSGESIVLFGKRPPETTVIDNRDVSVSNGSARFTPPVWQEDVEPDYPAEAKTSGLEGTVGMNFFVTEKGEVKLAQITKSSSYRILDDAATEFAKKLTFEPARNGDKPVGVWVSWIVDYKLVEKRFLLMNYIQKIEELRRRAEQSPREEKSRILQEMLNTHDDFMRYSSTEPNLNYNSYIQKIMKEEICEKWRDLWKEWPLHYLVFHDFICRYPDSNEASKAEASLLYYMKKDIDRIGEAANNDSNDQEKKELFFRTVYNFLAKEYPQSLTEDFKKEVNGYLEKKEVPEVMR